MKYTVVLIRIYFNEGAVCSENSYPGFDVGRVITFTSAVDCNSLVPSPPST
jgi:hypothetical protein